MSMLKGLAIIALFTLLLAPAWTPARAEVPAGPWPSPETRLAPLDAPAPRGFDRASLLSAPRTGIPGGDGAGGQSGGQSGGRPESPSDGPVATGDLDLATLMAKPGPKSSPELDCLARTIYFEARGEPLRGQAAVAEVVLNRVEAAGFPDTVCGVVRQGAEGGQAGCQFSYACDGQADRISDAVAFDLARRIAAAVIGGAPRTLTDGATYFHSRAVRPAWSRRFERTAVIGAQYFYREPLRTAQN